MLLFPAIDLLDGKVVRLKQGDYQQVSVYSDDPLSQAIAFAEAGATWLHVVDLNGARKPAAVEAAALHHQQQPAAVGATGQHQQQQPASVVGAAARQQEQPSPQQQPSSNRSWVQRIIRETGLKVEIGGGVRSLADIDALATLGAARIILGTALLAAPEMVSQAVREFGDLLCAGIDARDGKVAIAGWTETSTVSARDLGMLLGKEGVRHFLYTDIARDGLQTGIDPEAYRRLSEAIGLPLTASGGIAWLDDLHALRALGDKTIEAVIVGRALYEQNFTLAEALVALADASPTTGEAGL